MTTAEIIGLVAAVGAVAAAGAAAWQAYLLRFSIQVQSLLALEERFNGPEYQRHRHLAARQLLANQPGPDVEDVIGFFDTLGLLVRRRALDAEMVWHIFFYWLHGYWHATRAYIEQERADNEMVWADVPMLYRHLLSIESRRGVQHQVDVAEFLEGEAEQYQQPP
jgi:hypothetical protein